jgi:hypothetical protein
MLSNCPFRRRIKTLHHGAYPLEKNGAYIFEVRGWEMFEFWKYYRTFAR